MKIRLAKINTEKKRFMDFLSKSGINLTKARAAVFDEAMRAHGHFAAEELLRQCREHKKNVSRATVYRSLKELLSAGVIRETAFGEKHQHFEHLYDEKPHHHARCIKCGNQLEIPDCGEDKVYQPFLQKNKFKILGHEMHFYGICHQCQDKQ